MKIELTAMSCGTGRAMIIAHYPPRGDIAGFRGRVASVAKEDSSGRWTAILFGKAWPLHERLPADPQVITSVASERNLNGKHTLSDLVRKLADRDEWWTA